MDSTDNAGTGSGEDGSAVTAVRERGFLLIADMESSTLSKYVLDAETAFLAQRTHNRIIVRECAAAAPVAGTTLNSLGDAVVTKFVIGASIEDALEACLQAARRIVPAFEALAPVTAEDGRPFAIRTKLLLQYYDAFSYGNTSGVGLFADELVGSDIDLAFRLAPVAWRLQVLATENFLNVLLNRSEVCGGAVASAQGALDRAHLARHHGALEGQPLRGLDERYRFRDLDFWLTDAREIARLKGVSQPPRVFNLVFTDPETLHAQHHGERLSIKVRQDHHAVILVSIAQTADAPDNYIEHVVDKLRDSSEGNRLDSELTLFVAAKVFGEVDFFFRVSCIDDTSLQRFFHAIHDDAFGVRHVDVRSTLSERFAVTRRYPRLFERLDGRPYEIILTWFEREPGRDLFMELKALLNPADAGERAVEILEVGEVIHRTPVYAIFVCENLHDYAAFFAEHGLTPTGSCSHVGHIDAAADAQLRYSLMSAVYTPRQWPDDDFPEHDSTGR